ncbi:MAG TPA: lipopolysaccharide biosynthesis protein, partial [Leptolinea sp.]
MTQPTGITPKFFTKVALRGTLWNYLSFTAGKLLNFITTMILARLLLPEQFGLVGYCTIAIQYIDIINTAGINNALIARKDKIEEASNAAIVINICMGVISFGIAWMIAPLIADFFNAPEVTNLFRVLSVVLVIDGFGLVPDTLIQRSLRFQTMVIPNVSRTFAKGATSIVLALLGWGPWSLIWGQIAGEIVAVILCWILVNWHPTWKFDWQVTKELMQYGSHIIIIGFAGAIHSNVDYIIVGRVLGSAALGYYTMAYRLPELAIGSFNSVVSGVLFPLLSRTQSDIEALRKFYFRYVRYLSLITFAIGTGLMLVAKLFVEDFLSNKWEPTIFPMSLIAIALAISSTGYAPGVLYKSINRPEILSRLS